MANVPILGNDATVIHLVEALYGVAPGYNVLTTHDAYVAANGQDAYAGALCALSTFHNMTDTQFAQTLMDNLGLSAVNAAHPGASLSVADLAAYITNASGGVESDSVRGTVALQLCNILAGLEGATGDQAVYSDAAAAFNAETNNAYTYSTNSANTSPSVVSSTTAGLTVALTSGADQPTLSSSDDHITGLLGTFNTNDVIDGGAGNDTLTVRIDGTGGGLASILTPQVTNVETLNFIAMTDSASVGFQNMQGYNSVNIWGGSSSAQLANMTATTIGVLSGFGGDLTVTYASETGNADTLTLNVGQASAFSVTETAFAGGNAMEALSVIAASGTGVDITTLQSSALSSVSITGSANVTMALSVDSTISGHGVTVNASALQGNLTLTLGSSTWSGASGAAGIKVNAGTGNDTIVLTASALNNAYSALTVDGGAGTDTVSIHADVTGNVLPTLVNVEHVAIVGTTANVTAGFNFASAASIATLEVTGDSTAGQRLLLENTTANLTVAVDSGYGGTVVVSPANAAGTADTLTINATNAGSAFRLDESAIGLETITLNFAGTGYSGGTANFWNVGTADVTIGGSVNVNIALHYESGFVGTGDANLNATALQGNLAVTYDGTAHAVNINAGTGNDTIDLGTSLFGGVNAVTAVVDGGQGNDTLAFNMLGGNTAMPYGNSIENVNVTYDSSIAGANLNVSHVSGLTNLTLSLMSGISTAIVANNLNVTNVTLAAGISSTTAVKGDVNLNFVSGNSVTLNVIGATGGSGIGFSAINANSASQLTLNMTDSAGPMSLGHLVADQATGLTIDANGTSLVTIGEVSANNAGLVVMNDTAGGGLALGTATFATATLVTLNAAGSGNGLKINSLQAVHGGLTINASNSASVLISTGGATIGGDLHINAIGGSATISAIDIAIMSGHTAESVNLVAGNTGDVVHISSMIVCANDSSANAFSVSISGSGNVTLGGGNFSALNNGTSIHFDASNLVGTLSIGGFVGGSGIVVTLGNDVNSANSAVGGADADTIEGGSSHDYIAGGAGNDNLGGGAGNDTIIGGAGQDTMSGGAGNDTFVFLSHSAVDGLDATAGQQDFITDFGSGDVITFSGVTAVTYGSAGLAATAVGAISVLTASMSGMSFVSSYGAMAIFQDSGNTIVQVNLSSAGAAVNAGSGLVQITLNGITSFTSLTSLFNVTMGSNGLSITHV